LELDSGGLKAWSMLVILDEISNRIMSDLKLETPPSLCDYLDMVAGTGIGGQVVICLATFVLIESTDILHF
jgi:patatin-like phospholipase/acyl hydrolase